MELTSVLALQFPNGIVADGQQHIVEWTNPETCTIKIKKTLIWCGMSKGQISDFGAHLVTIPGGLYVSVVGWDHYCDPTGLHQFVNDFHGDHMSLKVGEKLRLIAFATSENVPPGNGGVVVWVWYGK